MTFYDYQLGEKPYSKSDDLVEEAPSLTPGIDAAVENYDQRLKQENQPTIDKLKLDHPGMTWGNVDVNQMVSDGAVPQPSEDGMGVSFIDERYFPGGESKGQWGYDFTSKTLQPKSGFDRVVGRTSANIVESMMPTLTGLTPGMATGEGLMGAALVGAGHLMDMYSEFTGKEPSDNEAFDKLMLDKIEQLGQAPDLMPDVRTAHPDTVQGMVEDIASDVLTILADIGIGNKLLRVARLDPMKAQTYIKKMLEFGKRTMYQERGVALGEMMYSKGGTPGNLSTMLQDFGFGGPLTEYLDSTEFDSEAEMAAKNVMEGVIISKGLQTVGASVKLGRILALELARYMKEYQPRAPGGPGMHKGMVDIGGTAGNTDDVLLKVAKMSPTGKQWAEASMDDIDRAAFGFARSEIKILKPEELEIKWKDDLENVKHEIEQSGKTEEEWAETISLKEPIDAIYEDGVFKVSDGHHRYMAAKILNKELKVNLEIKDKPHKAIVDRAKAEGFEVNQELIDSVSASKKVN